MDEKSTPRHAGVESVLDPVIERLSRQIEVELRLAREDFERRMGESRRRQQALFLLALAVFAASGLILAGGTYWAVASLQERARQSVDESAGAAGRLDRIEEDVRAHLETLQSLERRLRVGILESVSAPTVASPPASPAAPPP